MTSPLQEAYKKLQTPQDNDMLRTRLSKLCLVDFGIITAIDEAGRADVRMFDMNDVGDFVHVQAEVLGDANGLELLQEGMICLVVYPKSPIYSLADKLVYTDTTAFDNRAIKCIPLAPYAQGYKVGMSRMGDSMSISSPEYNLTLTPDVMTFMSQKYQLLFSATQMSLSFGNTLSYSMSIDSTGKWVQSTGNTYDEQNEVTNWKNQIEQNPDGSLHIQTAGSVKDDHTSFGQADVLFGTDGSIDIKAGVAKDAKIASQITLSPQGNIKVAVFDNGTEKSSIVLDKAGTVTITTADKYTLSGKGVEINGTDGKVSIKNGSANLYTDVLKTTLQKLNTSLATQGSPGAHTVVPNQFQTEADALDALME